MKKMDSQSERLLDWQATLNTRELGGYPLSQGGQTLWKALVRSENPALLNEQGQQALLDYGIRTIIDLRFPFELEVDPSPFSRSGEDGLAALTYKNIPLDVDQDLEYQAGQDAAVAMGNFYSRLLETNRGHVAAVLRMIVSARPGGVLFHCYAGKDRTGLIAALLLSGLGVPDEVVIQDYAFTTPRVQERNERDLAKLDLQRVRLEYYQALFNNLPDTMALTLKTLNQTYGSALGYLKTAGLQPEELDVLRERCTA